MKLSRFNVIVGDWSEFVTALYTSGHTLPDDYKFCKWPENDFIATRFPTKQAEEAAEVVRWFNEGGSPFVIVTNSPYILEQFNNCLYAHYKGQSNPDETAELVPKEFWLDGSQVAAYKCWDGKVEDLIDYEDGLILIKSEAVDTVSQIINATFDALAEINP